MDTAKEANRASVRTRGLAHYWGAICRWIRIPLLRAYEWRFFPLYWRARNLWQRLKFAFSKRVYAARGRVRIAAESTSTVLLILKTVAGELLFRLFRS